MTYIAHHGILGQKWGIRRFQNKDGTLTAAGRRRYQVMTNPETGEQIKSAQFTPEQLARAKEHGYTVEDVEERDERGIEEARAHRKRMIKIGAAVVGVAIAALLIKRGIKNRAARKAAIEESGKQLDEFREKAGGVAKKVGDKLFDLVDTRVPDSAVSKVKRTVKAGPKLKSSTGKGITDVTKKIINNGNALKDAAASTSEAIAKLDNIVDLTKLIKK